VCLKGNEGNSLLSKICADQNPRCHRVVARACREGRGCLQTGERPIVSSWEATTGSAKNKALFSCLPRCGTRERGEAEVNRGSGDLCKEEGTAVLTPAVPPPRRAPSSSSRATRTMVPCLVPRESEAGRRGRTPHRCYGQISRGEGDTGRR
jgi:hypothetical protein